ncbi:RNA triphosphatase [Novymonas esmeraldas]|uniref:mRNA 5'-phosphatase n=1 Tax=Novymonas esmeraldas TaxID=1808958 RepID=A0AAW0EKA0_9TRYP
MATSTPTPPRQASVEADVPASAAVSTVAAASPAPPPDTGASSLGAVAAALLARLQPFLAESHLEVEARLCRLGTSRKRARTVDDSDAAAAAARKPTVTEELNASDATPHLASAAQGGVEVGVSAEDFARMKAYVESSTAAPLSFTETVTEDVNTRAGRYTYAIAADGSGTFVGCMSKKRLCNVEVRVPGSPYDIRVSLSTEVPQPTTTAPAVKPHGYVRWKRRWTAADGTFEYAFTRIGADTDRHPACEVEVEGLHENTETGVTAAWLEDLLGRLTALARLPGNTGLEGRQTSDANSRKRHR